MEAAGCVQDVILTERGKVLSDPDNIINYYLDANISIGVKVQHVVATQPQVFLDKDNNLFQAPGLGLKLTLIASESGLYSISPLHPPLSSLHLPQVPSSNHPN